MESKSLEGVCDRCKNNYGQRYSFFYGYSQSEEIEKDSNGKILRKFYYDMQKGYGLVCETCVMGNWEKRKRDATIYIILTGIFEMLLLSSFIVYPNGGQSILVILSTALLIVASVHFYLIRNEDFIEMGSHSAIQVKKPELEGDGWNVFYVPEDFAYKKDNKIMFMVGDEPIYKGKKYGYTTRQDNG